MRRGTPPRGRVPLRQRRFRPVLGTGPARWRRSWARVSRSALGLRGAGVRPSRDTPGACARRLSNLVLRRCHVTRGRHALLLREPLWGSDSRWSTMSLSHPRPSRCGVLGRSRQPNGALSLTALCDRTAAFPAGVSGTPGSECSPLQGTPFFASPGIMWRLGRRLSGPPGVWRCGDCRICVPYGSTDCVMFWGAVGEGGPPAFAGDSGELRGGR